MSELRKRRGHRHNKKGSEGGEEEEDDTHEEGLIQEKQLIEEEEDKDDKDVIVTEKKDNEAKTEEKEPPAQVVTQKEAVVPEPKSVKKKEISPKYNSLPKTEEKQEIYDEDVERVQKELEAFKALVLEKVTAMSKDVSLLKRKSRSHPKCQSTDDELIEKIKKTNAINEKKIKVMIFQHREEVNYLEKGKTHCITCHYIVYLLFLFILENKKLKKKLNDLLNQNQKNYCFLFIMGLALLTLTAAYFLH